MANMRLNGEATQPHQLELRLMVDQRKMRLVYAECERSMADVLFGFLTTPVGALVRRTDKASGLPCMDNIYKSVEGMNVDKFQTPACKELLLRPRDAWSMSLHLLKLRINDVDEAQYYCPDYPHTCRVIGSMPNSDCTCGGKLSVKKYYTQRARGGMVFIRKGLGRFVVTDELIIRPSSPAVKQKICDFFGVERPSLLEEVIVHVGFEQLLQLLKLSLVSNSPLTDAFLPSDFLRKTIIRSNPNPSRTHSTMLGSWISKIIGDLHWKYSKKKMEIIVFHDPKNRKIGLAKGGRDFVDLLFSFLIFPFGSISAALGRQSCLGCLDYLHQSMKLFIYNENMSSDSNPPIAPHHQPQTLFLLKVGRKPCPMCWLRCEECREKGTADCIHGIGNPKLKWLNPKFEEATTKKGGGYIQQPEKFFISNTLVVQPISEGIDYGIPSGLQEKRIVFGPKEALELLRAALSSEDPLTSAFAGLL